VDDLRRVSGVGPAMLEKLKPEVRTGDPDFIRGLNWTRGNNPAGRQAHYDRLAKARLDALSWDDAEKEQAAILRVPSALRSDDQRAYLRQYARTAAASVKEEDAAIRAAAKDRRDAVEALNDARLDRKLAERDKEFAGAYWEPTHWTEPIANPALETLRPHSLRHLMSPKSALARRAIRQELRHPTMGQDPIVSEYDQAVEENVRKGLRDPRPRRADRWNEDMLIMPWLKQRPGNEETPPGKPDVQTVEETQLEAMEEERRTQQALSMLEDPTAARLANQVQSQADLDRLLGKPMGSPNFVRGWNWTRRNDANSENDIRAKEKVAPPPKQPLRVKFTRQPKEKPEPLTAGEYTDIGKDYQPVFDPHMEGFVPVLTRNAARDPAPVVSVQDEIAAQIDQTQQSIDMAAYEIDNQAVLNALLRAKDRGVKVRVVTSTENLPARGIKQLKAAGVPIVDSRRPGALMHNKFMVLDGKAVQTGSVNYTESDLGRNDNNAPFIESPEIAANYQAKFDQMFGGDFGKYTDIPNPSVVLSDGTQIDTVFSGGKEINSRIAAEIAKAKNGVKFLGFSFTSPEIADAMLAAAEKGIPVDGVFEKRNSRGSGSQYDRLQSAGGPVHVFVDANPRNMHHKAIIIDDDTVITGSANLSKGADRNDENLLVIKSPKVAQQFKTEFDRVYDDAGGKVRHEALAAELQKQADARAEKAAKAAAKKQKERDRGADRPRKMSMAPPPKYLNGKFNPGYNFWAHVYGFKSHRPAKGRRHAVEREINAKLLTELASEQLGMLLSLSHRLRGPIEAIRNSGPRTCIRARTTETVFS
jgi:phosphatidylserine/phosphatidylglycerophosphate/cardiolipin synthase-like enzyme